MRVDGSQRRPTVPPADIEGDVECVDDLLGMDQRGVRRGGIARDDGAVGVGEVLDQALLEHDHDAGGRRDGGAVALVPLPGAAHASCRNGRRRDR